MAKQLPEQLREKLESIAADSGELSTLALAILMLESRCTGISIACELTAMNIKEVRQELDKLAPAAHSTGDIEF